jgi:hypothetical protein
MGRGYFSIKEFQAVVCTMTAQAKLYWLSLAGDVLNEKDSAELQNLLEDFFSKRSHRSLRKHSNESDFLETQT